MREVPTAYDLERFLIASGMIGLTPSVREQYLDLTLAIDAAYKDFQRDTKISPFFAETSDSTKYYSINGPYVQLHPYHSITSVYMGRKHETTSEAKTAVTDYEFVYDEETIVGLELGSYYYDGGKIGITGKRGWSDDFPADAFQAILAQASGVHLQPSISAAIHSGAIKWQEGDVSEQYGAMGAYSASVDKWASTYMNTVNRYKRVQVYGAGRL